MTTPVVDRLFADLVLLRDFSDRCLVGLPQDRDHLLFGETDLLHGTPLSIREPFSQVPTGPKNLGGSEEQIIKFLKEADSGVPIKELCRRHGFSEASYYLWRSKFGGMDVSDAKRLKALEAENTRLKKLLAESLLENEVTREALRKKW